MAICVCNGANMQCGFGLAPSPLVVTPANKVMSGPPMANIMDNKPMVNVMPFGMCSSMANPTVASATAAALGVLTPMPCVPVLPAPWLPGSPKVLVNGQPALTNSCQLLCAYAGVIAFVSPGQTKVQAP